MTLKPQRDVAIAVLAKVLVGVRGAPSYQVLELQLDLPKYACYAAMDKTRCAARRLGGGDASLSGSARDWAPRQCSLLQCAWALCAVRRR